MRAAQGRRVTGFIGPPTEEDSLVGSTDNTQKLLALKLAQKTMDNSASRMIRQTSCWMTKPVVSAEESGLDTRANAPDTDCIGGTGAYAGTEPIDYLYLPGDDPTGLMVDPLNIYSPIDPSQPPPETCRPATEREVLAIMRAWALADSLGNALDAIDHWTKDSERDAPICPEVTMSRSALAAASALAQKRRQLHRNGTGANCLAAIADHMSPFIDSKRDPPPATGRVLDILPDTRQGTFQYLDLYAAEHRAGDQRRAAAAASASAQFGVQDRASQRAYERVGDARARAQVARQDPEATPFLTTYWDGVASRQTDIALDAELEIQAQVASESHERAVGRTMFEEQDDACRPSASATCSHPDHAEGASMWTEPAPVDGSTGCSPSAGAAGATGNEPAGIDGLLATVFHDRIPPDVRATFHGAQTRLLVGDAKFALMLEAAIGTAVDAACAADLAERAALVELVHTLSRTAIMHGELHLFFHACQAAYKLFWSMLLGPCAGRLRKTGRNPDKGPIEKWEAHLADQSEVLDAVVLLKLVKIAEDRPADLDGLFNPDGQLVHAELAALFDGPAVGESDLDDAVNFEFSQQTAASVAALAGAREHVTVFLDAYTKETTAVFQATRKTTYTLLAMRATEMIKFMMSDYVRMLWAENRTITERHRAKLLDEKCEGFNHDVKPLAGDRGDMSDYGEIATHVVRSRRGFDSAVGISEDVGGGLGAKPDDLIETFLLLQGAGVGTGGGAGVGDATIAEHAVPSVKTALWLALAGAVVTATVGTGPQAYDIKGTVVRVQQDRATGTPSAVIDWGSERGVETLPFCALVSSDVDYAAALSTAASKALVDEGKDGAPARSSGEGVRAALAAYVGSANPGGLSPASAADSFGSSDLATGHDAEVTPRHPEPGELIAHVFTGKHAGWYIGTVQRVEDQTFYSKYRGDPTVYPHELPLQSYNLMWVVVKGRRVTAGPTPAPAVITPTAGVSNRGDVVIASLPPGFGDRVDDLVRRVRTRSTKAGADEAGTEDVEEHVARHGAHGRHRRKVAAAKPSVLGAALLEKISAVGRVESATVVKAAPVKSAGVPPAAHRARSSGRASLIRGEVVKRRVAVHKKRAAALQLALDSHARTDQAAAASKARASEGSAMSALDRALDGLHQAEARLIAEHDETIARIALIEQVGDAATDADRASLRALVDRLTVTEAALERLQGLDVDDPD